MHDWKLLCEKRRKYGQRIYPHREPVLESYLSAWHHSALWIAGAVALTAGNKNIFLTEGHVQDFLLSLMVQKLTDAIGNKEDDAAF